MKKLITSAASLLIIFSFLILNSSDALAQKSKKKKKGDVETEEKKEEPKSKKDLIEKYSSKSISYPGLFQFYQDSTTGDGYLVIRQDQLEKEFIYFSHTVDGVLEAGFGLIRGGYRGSRIFTIHKYFDRIEIRVENTRYYYDPDSKLSNASRANVNNPIVFSEEIKAYSETDDAYLVDANDLFLTEAFQQVKPSPPTKPSPGRFSLGSLSKSKTKYEVIKNYPLNTDVVVDYVFDSSYPKNSGSEAVKDARSISVTVRHSLIQMPENDYVPRRDDQRMGYFSTQITDLTSTSATPYRDLIHRWHLVKKDPSAALSEPVEPIVFWLENTTPMELREAVAEGALRWNLAFETAGFKNAIVVKQQPDTADWDAGDIRYNVIRWVSSPDPAYGGYGPSFVNPRTGQIIGADIMLEYVWVTNRLRDEKLLASSSYEEELFYGSDLDPSFFCTRGTHLQTEMMFGRQVTAALDYPAVTQTQMLKESLYSLSLHEVGHTLGLMHNMMASNLHSPEDLNNSKLTQEVGLSSSVMDYDPVNIGPGPDRQGEFFATVPGPYDHWVIEYGYSQGLEDPLEEEKRLSAILARSTQKELQLGNDADDMRAPGRHIDPRAMINDLSNDPIAYGLGRIELANRTLPVLVDKYSDPGKSWEELRNAYMILTRIYGNSLEIMTRQVGGVYVDRSVTGQEGANPPLVPVSYDDQKRAMKVLTEYGFGPDAFEAPTEVYQYLLKQRRGFDHYRKNEDFKIHDWILGQQKGLLDHLLHRNVLERISDSEMYGNKYDLSEYWTELTNAIFKGDPNLRVNTVRQNLQIEYTDRLISIVSTDSKYHQLAQSMALFELNRISKLESSTKSADLSTRAHRQNVVYRIDKALDD